MSVQSFRQLLDVGLLFTPKQISCYSSTNQQYSYINNALAIEVLGTKYPCNAAGQQVYKHVNIKSISLHAFLTDQCQCHCAWYYIQRLSSVPIIQPGMQHYDALIGLYPSFLHSMPLNDSTFTYLPTNLPSFLLLLTFHQLLGLYFITKLKTSCKAISQVVKR